ncbi:hypothetical protein H2200_002078 [Cladophialophora chaetospira]|uniref:Protein YTP1-like C-terminal domain-containing protein n=1 Tax=Cladophialophora chaetospira TaxID=386627 RepID=A0AA39CMQ6_9EURO|nr:hypothetical protein H2200_002078 [Cladophialophora chaetospira]
MIGSAIILVIVTIDGERWIRRTGRSLDFYACAMIAASGCGNALFEHIPGSEWNHREYSHVAFGVFWWLAGIVGLWQTRKHDQRSAIPGVVLIVTGWYFTMHEQPNAMAKHVHEILGYVMMAAGAVHFIEIVHLARDSNRSGVVVDLRPHKSQSPPEFALSFLLIVQGVINIFAPPQVLWLFDLWGLDYISLMLIWFSIAMGIMCFTILLVNLYRSLKFGKGRSNRRHNDVGSTEDLELSRLLSEDMAQSAEEEPKVPMSLSHDRMHK